MTEPLSESELLAYVEGELDAIQVQRIRDRLAGEGHVLAALERMREDRKLLRTAGEPVPPIDFLTELEPQLARPMLIEPPPPGAYRRRHRRRRRAARFTRIGLAAAVLLVVSGAVWVALSLAGPRLRGDGGDELAAPSAQAPGEISDRAVAADTSSDEAVADQAVWPPPGTVILHERPLPPGPEFAVAMSAGDGPAGDDLPSPLGGDGAGEDITLVSAEFALIVPAEDLAAGERLLEQSLAAVAASTPDPAGAPVALVRNFTEAEARGLIARYFAPRPGDPSAPQGYADAGGGPDRPSFEDPLRRRRWVDRMLRELRAQHQEEAEEVLLSAHLLGPDELAASYERQLSFSGRGATHTITLPVASLPDLLTRLYESEDARATLRLLPPEDDARRLQPEARPGRLSGAGAGAGSQASSPRAADDAALRQWADDHRRIRQFLARLRERHEDEAYVLLPVVIRTPPDGTPARR
jgi:hypothetical protein